MMYDTPSLSNLEVVYRTVTRSLKHDFDLLFYNNI